MASSSPKLHPDIFDHYGNKNLSVGYLSPSSDTLFDDSDVYTSDEEDEQQDEEEDDSEYDVSEPEVSKKSDVPVANTRRTSNAPIHPTQPAPQQQLPTSPQQQQTKRTDLAAPRHTETPTIFQKLTKANVDWCRYCGTTEGVNWRPGPWGKRTLCK